MRLSDLDIQKASRDKINGWRSTINLRKQEDLEELIQFAKDKRLELSDLDKEMLYMAMEINKDEFEKEFISKMKQFYASSGRNYEIERQMKQTRVANTKKL